MTKCHESAFTKLYVGSVHTGCLQKTITEAMRGYYHFNLTTFIFKLIFPKIVFYNPVHLLGLSFVYFPNTVIPFLTLPVIQFICPILLLFHKKLAFILPQITVMKGIMRVLGNVLTCQSMCVLCFFLQFLIRSHNCHVLLR